MELNSLKAQIKSGSFDHFYIWKVDEPAIARVYRDMIAKKSGANVSYVDTIADVFGRARSRSLLSTKTLYVIIDDKDFLRNERAWKALGDGSELKDDIVIFYYTSADQRLKFWKNFKDRAIEFGKLDDRLLVKHIQKDVPLSEKSCHTLIDVCEGDYSRILLEIDKIQNYSDSINLGDYDMCLLQLLDEGAIYKQPKDAIFDFVSAVLDRKPKLAYDLLEQSYAVGEANMVLLSVLYNNFRAVLQVQTCASSDVAKSTGLNGWQIKNARPFIDRYTDDELIHALEILRETEVGIKRGEISDEVSVNYCLVNIL